MNRKILAEDYLKWCMACGIASDEAKAHDLHRLAALPPTDYSWSHTYFTNADLLDTSKHYLWRNTFGYKAVPEMDEIVFISEANDGGKGMRVPPGEAHACGHFTVIHSPIGEIIHFTVQQAPQIALLSNHNELP